MTRCSLQCEGERALWKEQTCQKRVELQALWLCHDRPTSLFQEELELEESPSQTYHPGWEPGNWLFFTRLLPELTQVDFWAMATTSQRLVEGARCSAKTQAITAQLPAYVMEFRSVFAKEDFDMLPEYRK